MGDLRLYVWCLSHNSGQLTGVTKGEGGRGERGGHLVIVIII